MTLSPVEDDWRAQRVALSASEVGWQVTLLGLGGESEVVESRLGKVTVLQVAPITGRTLAPASPVLTPPRLAYRTRAEGLGAGHLLRVRQRDVQVQVARAQLRQRRLAAALPAPVRAAPRVGTSLVVRTLRAKQAALARLHHVRWAALQKLASAGATPDRRAVAAWRMSMVDADLRLGPVLERLRPDVVDAQGTLALVVAARAVARLRAAGNRTALVLGAQAEDRSAQEQGHHALELQDAAIKVFGDMDAVVASTQEVADGLRRLIPPAVPVTLIPDGVETALHEGLQIGATSDLSVALGLEGPAQVVVHLGPLRSEGPLMTVAHALAGTPDVHLCLLAVTPGPVSRSLHESAGRVIGGHRFHVLDVPRVEALRLLPGAAVGVVAPDPPAGTTAAPATGYAELVAAGVPVLADLTSSAGALAVRQGTGEAVEPGSTTATRRALTRLLGDPARYRANAETAWRTRDPRDGVRWDPTALASVYANVAGRSPTPGAVTPTAAPAVLRRVTRRPEQRVLGVGPANFAGQGWEWAKSAERAVPGLRTEVFAVEQGVLTFQSDRRITRRQLRQVAWQLEQQARVLTHYTHLLAEANRPVFGYLNGNDLSGDLSALTRSGVRVGLVMHGSDVRDPYRHRDLVPDSPFHGDEEFTRTVAAFVRRTQAVLEGFDGPVMVATPDLLDDVPRGIWLPVVVDVDRWASSGAVLEREVPLVVHVPSKARLKGSAAVEDVLRGLVQEGLVEYRHLSGVPPENMPGVVADADIVLDQFALGSYGVLACEAMAAGRLVVGHVRDEVRTCIGAELPVVEATATTLADVLRGVLADREGARATAAAGTRFVHEVHDGTVSGAVLRTHLLEEPSAS